LDTTYFAYFWGGFKYFYIVTSEEECNCSTQTSEACPYDDDLLQVNILFTLPQDFGHKPLI
jgi:hypothetical protein